MEINKPGGFLLLILDKLSVDSNQKILVKDIETKIKELGNLGITTYGFERGFDNELVSGELYDDLRVFEDVGWVEVYLVGSSCIITDRGRRIATGFELPELAKSKFEKIFR